MRKKTEYVGSVYIGVVGGTLENGECRDSIQNIHRRPGDSMPRFIRGTKGFETRQAHFDYWLGETRHPFMLLLDHDMIYPPDTLERLRSHGLPYVSGFYLRRRYAPIAPVWFYLPPRGTWPMEVYTGVPERGRLHPLGASGWGCVLVHREVAEAVARILKGEPFVLEDDMDVWPYDLNRVMGAIHGLRGLVDAAPSEAVLRPALAQFVGVLEEEIRPLRGDKAHVGSDLRFPFYAREAGYVLMGDPDVRVSHMLDYPLSPDDFEESPGEMRNKVAKDQRKAVTKERKRLRQNLTNLRKAVL